MQRREFMSLLGAAAVPIPLHAQKKAPRVGVFLVGGPELARADGVIE
jgi:hypothetical protein